MLFGILSRCDSMSEFCEGMKTIEGNLSYIGFDAATAKSTASDGLREREITNFFKIYILCF